MEAFKGAKNAQASPRGVGDGVVQPTPTQEENDLAAAGVVPNVHEWDGTPVQYPHGEPDRPDIPPDLIPPAQAPVLSSLSPASAVAGDAADITMTVNGTGFTPGSVIVMNGYDEPTTVMSTTQVRTGVKPSLFVVPADVPVLVRNSDKTSNELTFTFTVAGTGTQKAKR
jgi:hypothetical protein